MRLFRCLRLVLLVAAMAWVASAQSIGEPLFLIRIVRGGPDTATAVPYRATGVPVDVLGMKSITGPSQNWLIETHRSFATIETVDNALAAASNATRAPEEYDQEAFTTRWIGMYRQGLSYRPTEAIKLLQTARYYQISIFRIRPGADFDFAELIRLRRAAFDTVNLDRPEICYQIISGETSSVYVFLAPLPSLKTMDSGLARSPVYGEIVAQTGGRGGKHIAAEADVTREHLLFRVDPSRSYVTEEFAAQDPEFWRVK